MPAIDLILRRSSVCALLVLFAASVVSLFAAPVAVAGDTVVNPLPDPGFEDGDQHQTIESGWTIDDDTSHVIADAAHTGRLGLRVGTAEYNPGGASVSSARFPVAAGQKITVTFWARTRARCSAVYLMFYKPDGKLITDPQQKAGGGHPACPVNDIDNAWRRYTLHAQAPSGVATVAIWIHAYAGEVGVADYDDFTLGGIAPGAVPVPSPSRRRAAKSNDSPVNLPPRKQPPVIILKLDDLKQVRGDVPARWRQLADYRQSRHIKAGFGIICDTLRDAAPQFIQWIKDHAASGQIEFWFHGWDHATHKVNGEAFNEFSHRSYEEQKQRFDDSQKLALEKSGFPFRTFGPPGGVYSSSFDAETIRVMADDPHMKVWLYPQPIDDAGKKLEAAGKITILDRVWDVNLEGAVGVPDCKRLMKGYANHPDREYFALQGHPGQWDENRFAEFSRIIDFLVAQKAIFMTPTEYAAQRSGQAAGAR